MLCVCCACWTGELTADCCEQALKANPERAPRELKVNANYIGRFGQVALTEALDMVYEMAGGREIVITY